MKKIYPIGTILSIFLLFAGSVLAQQLEQQPSGPGQSRMQIYMGELTKVDATAKTIWVKGSDGAEMDFLYNEQTQIIGAEGGVEGLATESGSPVKVYFDQQSKTALKIEVHKRRK